MITTDVLIKNARNNSKTRMTTFQITSLDNLQILQNIKIILTNNHYSKICGDKAIISCKNRPV